MIFTSETDLKVLLRFHEAYLRLINLYHEIVFDDRMQ
jgi:hypothetical protein